MLTELLAVTMGVQAVGGIATVLVGTTTGGTVGAAVDPAVVGATADGADVDPGTIGVVFDSAANSGKLQEIIASHKAINT